jgi:2-octaprenyl-6-methoxyphenol hydroxylase
VPINSVHVSVQGALGSSRLADDTRALGFVVGLNELEQALSTKLIQDNLVQIRRPCEIKAYEKHEHGWRFTLSDSNETVEAKLLVFAEGGASSLFQQQHIPVQIKDYQHVAIVAQLEMSQAHDHRAFERFLSDGAIALLPGQGNQSTLIWTIDQARLAPVLALNDAAFINEVQSYLGHRAGSIQSISPRKSFKLQMEIATEQQGRRYLLMGQSAHKLHPIAAQGLNLSLRDIWQLKGQLLSSPPGSMDLGHSSFLTTYVNARKQDQDQIIMMTDFLADWVSSRKIPTFMKSIGILLFDAISPLKRQFVYFNMGLMS